MSSAVNLNNYIFKIKDKTNNIFEFDTSEGEDTNTIRQLVVKDSIFDMYPTAQFVFVDRIATNYLNSPFMERQEVEIEMAIYNTDIKINHSFYWARNILTEVQLSKNIGGKIINTFLSNYKYYDKAETKTYSAMPPSMVATSIVAQMGTPPPKTFFTPTTNARNWHQGNRTKTSFIREVLAKYAYSAEGYPFMAYFNLANEFHFRSVDSLYKETPAPLPKTNQGATLPDKYTVDFSVADYTVSRNYVQAVMQLDYLGNETNHNLYSLEFTHINGVKYVDKSKTIKDYKSTKTKPYPIRNDSSIFDLPFPDVNQNIFLGYFNTKDLTSKDGLINNHFLNTMFPLRMKIMIFFDPYQVAGRSIELNVFDPNGEDNQILSGKWLIVASTHSYNHVDGLENRIIYTTLDLAKGVLDITDLKKYMI
jgi:hypothetical protein